jgi:hypothetical protein
MEFLTELDFKQLSNPGVVSLQVLSPRNSTSLRVTITRVTVAPGASQPRHLQCDIRTNLDSDGGNGKTAARRRRSACV